MGKFRSKLKRHSKGKNWGKGNSSTSNPEQMKHRLKAKSRFFKSNLSLVNADPTTENNALTLEAVMKHDERHFFNTENATVNDVVGSLCSISLSDLNDEEDEGMSNSQRSTFKTFRTFASNYSACSNMSFRKLFSSFRATSELHKEMLAIVSALTEIIKERGGQESSTEYFLLLMKQIETCSEINELSAGISVLSMGIKTVPIAVLRKRFSETASILLACLQRFVTLKNQGIIKYIIGCLSVLLRAQEYATWSFTSSWQYIDALLTLTIHTKPKIRKAAQHAIVSIIYGSCFMLPTQAINEGDNNGVEKSQTKFSYHPAGSRVARFCISQFKTEVLVSSQTTVLYSLALLKDTLSRFKMDDICSVCEHLLSMMTAANLVLRTNCMQTLYSLFISHTVNISGEMCGRLLTAIHQYRPDRTDVRQTLAWLTVLKEGHIHLNKLNQKLCMASLPRLIDVCSNDLWISDRNEIITSVASCIKELLIECVSSACLTAEIADIYRRQIECIIASLIAVLNTPFGDISKYVILTFSEVFNACGKHFCSVLTPALITLSNRYDSQSTLRIQIEHALIAAIKNMGPEEVLKVIPLTSTRSEVLLNNSWLLPLLREGIQNSSFKFFKESILPIALACNAKWHKFEKEKQVPLSHTYELLCCQLWGLLPGICRQPNDPENFCLIAQTLGNALDNNPEFRAPIFDGLIELIQWENSIEMQEILNRYAKNFIPRLFNIYTHKPEGTYESDLRKKSLEVIQLYLTKTSDDVIKQLFEIAQKQLCEASPGTFEYDAIYDITTALILFQTSETIFGFFNTFIVPVLKKEKSKLVSKDEDKLRKQQRKTYVLLRDILTSEAPSCKKFCRKNTIVLESILLDAFSTSCLVCQAARLRCLKHLIDNRKCLSINDKVVMKIVPEAILVYKEFSTRKERISEEIIKLVANSYQEAGMLNEFVDILTAGFVGDESLITNTILAFCTVFLNMGKYLTISTLEFVLQQISVFVVQKFRPHAEASVAFYITFIKVMPTSLVSNHLETIMRSLSAMTKDTKRFCRIQIGYLLKKLCKRFSSLELLRFVPGDDDVTIRRLKKIRKQMRREARNKLSGEKDINKNCGENESEDDLLSGMEHKTSTIEDILADSDSDILEEMEEDNDDKSRDGNSKKKNNTYIREGLEDVVDLADVKSIGNVLTNRPESYSTCNSASVKGNTPKDSNRGFKMAEDGRLIINEKSMIGVSTGDETDDSDDPIVGKAPATLKDETRIKRGMEYNSSDDEESTITLKRQRKIGDAPSMRSHKTSSYYTTGGKGIHRLLDNDNMSRKSGYSVKSNKSAHSPIEYASNKSKGDMKKKGKLDPYAYIPLSRNTLNKRKRAKHAGTIKNIVQGARKGALKSILSKKSKVHKKEN